MLIVAALPGPSTWHSLTDLKGSLVALNSIPISLRSGLLNTCCRTYSYSSKLYVCRNLNKWSNYLFVSRCLVHTDIRQECRLMPDLSHLSDGKRILLQQYLSGNAVSSREGKAHITPRPRGNTAPLSLAQEQVWLHGQLAPPGVPVYNETLTIRRSGPLNLAALERTFAETIRRHEIWRTTFELRDGQPVQVVHPAEAAFKLPLVDLREIPELEREQEAVRIARAVARAPFNLQEGPLLRATLVKLSEGDHRLFLTFHQMIFDGVTAYQVFLPELSAIYVAFSQNQPSPLPDPPIQYADYAIWQREQTNPEAIAGQLAYWQRQLAGELPVLAWPSDQFRPALQTYRGEIQTAVMSKELLQNLKTLGQEQRVSLFMILVAGFASVLHRYTGQANIILGTPSAGR